MSNGRSATGRILPAEGLTEMAKETTSQKVRNYAIAAAATTVALLAALWILLMISGFFGLWGMD